MINLKKAVSVIAVAVLAGSLATPAVNAAPKNQARAVVQADWLEKNIDDPKVRIIEVSTEAGLYERGHITGARRAGRAWSGTPLLAERRV